MTCRHQWSEEQLDSRTIRLRVSDPASARPLSWAQVISSWVDDAGFCAAFCARLAHMPFEIFRWETPPLDEQSLEGAFECVVVDSPALPDLPDPTPFAQHFRRANNRSVITFANLGGDAELVVPCPVSDDAAYTHLARFVRAAPEAQQRTLWREVGLAMERRVGTRPVWLSTAGGGVAWLHVRLDDRPKYYAHAPYREIPSA